MRKFRPGPEWMNKVFEKIEEKAEKRRKARKSRKES
jgi:hypothetical protein